MVDVTMCGGGRGRGSRTALMALIVLTCFAVLPERAMGQDEPAQPPPAAQPAQKAPPPPAPRRVRELTEAPPAPSTAGANRAGATTAEPQRVRSEERRVG